MAFIMKKESDKLLQFPKLRQAAEAEMARMHEDKVTDAKTDELLHELHVHQLELEMQNDELQRTQMALADSLNRYVSLYEFAPVGYLTLSENGVIDEANLVSAELLGENRATLLKQRFERFISPEDGACWHQYFQKLVRQYDKHTSCDVKMRRADGSSFYARLTCLPLDLKNSTQAYTSKLTIRVALTDISEIKLAEQELRVAATVFEAREGMMVTDAHNIILKVNQAFTDMTGYSAQDVVGKTPHLLRSGRHDEDFYAAMWSGIHHAGAWQGELWNRKKCGDLLPVWLTITAVKTEAGEVSHYVATFTDITTRKVAEDELQQLAFYDSLTGLPNRRLLLDRMHRAIATSARTRRHCALMFIDLDNFKGLNDSLGHDTGDLMLKIVAQRLAISVREGDTVARLGGDEFLVMLENLSEDPQEAAALTEVIGNKILAAINKPFQLMEHEYNISASIGITMFTDHRYSVPELQKQADIAMYQAKLAGRNRLRFFKP